VRLTARRLNRSLLQRQLLLGRERLDVVDAVARVVALQAQEPASPYLALWARVADFAATDLDRAFARQDIVKTQLLRITLHAVTATDYPAFHEAMQPTLRGARLNDPRFRSAGLSVEAAEALLPEVLSWAATPRTNAEADAWLDARIGEHPKPSVWWAYRQFAPLVHAPTGGPWTFGPRPSYVAAIRQDRPGDLAASTQQLVRRYLQGFGPATLADIAQFTTILRPPIREAIAALDDSLVRHDGPDGVLYDVAEGAVPEEEVDAPPRLLPMWDSVLLASADRSRIIPAEFRRAVIRSNGDVLPTLLVDGYVAGVWRPVSAGIEAIAFSRLPEDAWEGLAAEARALLAFLAERGDPLPYRRFNRWYEGLPSAEVRVLAG
jgi:hypothetical protein